MTPFTALDARRPYASGARVGAVGIDSLAERIGLQAGDIIVGMNGRPIGHSGDLARALLAWRSVSGTTLTVFREQAYLELRLQ
ncbi:PDZ domain-containing protein [Methylibium sp.]|uniref:PDZ domain-containing protein n=1 Tax=Methylibium sp. TaxID=2067992 RepID=UPI003D09FFF0